MPKMTALVAVAVLLAGGAYGQEAQTKVVVRTPTALRLDVVFSRFQADKKIGSSVYQLPLVTGDTGNEVRMGVQIPLRFEGKEFPGNVVFKSVGNKVACNADALDGGLFKVRCALEQASASEDTQKASAASATPPVLWTFSSDASLLLRDGQTARQLMATDPVTGEVVKVEVTLNVVK